MWLSYLVLILPLTTGASVKLTKRRMSNPLLARRRPPIPRLRRDFDYAPLAPAPTTAVERRGRGRRWRRNVPDANDLPRTVYTTVQVFVVGSPPTGTATAIVPGVSGPRTIYSTVQVFVTLPAAGAPTLVNAIEGVTTAALGTGTAAGIAATTLAGAAVTGTVTGIAGVVATTNLVNSVTAIGGGQPVVTGATSVVPAAPSGTAQPVSGELVLAAADPWVYTIDMKIGPEGKAVPMLLDTGSYSFWAADAACTNCITGGMVGALVSDPTQCTKYDAAYGTGHFSGCIVETTVEFGPYKLDKMAMAAAVTMADELAVHGASFSGMLGLAMPGREGTTTPMTRLLSDGLVADPWVGLRLQREGEGESELIFGEALTSPHGDPAFHVDLPQRPEGGSQYNVTLDSLSILGAEVSDSYINGRGVILDSGTSNIVVPDARYLAILSKLSDDGKIKAHPKYQTAMLRCEPNAGVTEALSFTFGGVKFPVPWKDIVGPKIDLTGTVFDFPGAPAYCDPRIQSIGNDNWILGDAFLVNVYHAINTKTGGVQIWRLKP